MASAVLSQATVSGFSSALSHGDLQNTARPSNGEAGLAVGAALETRTTSRNRGLIGRGRSAVSGEGLKLKAVWTQKGKSNWRRSSIVAQAGDGEKATSRLEEAVDQAEQNLDSAADEVKTAAADASDDNVEAQKKSEDALRRAAEQLRGHAENLKSQASVASEQLLENAGKTKDDLAQQAGVTVEQLKAQTDKTAAQLQEEAQKATEELRIQAEKAGQQLAASAHETAERAKEELARVKDHAPDGIKDLAETAIEAHSKEKAQSGAVIHDFCLGIPYGGALFFGGLLWFLIAGSLHALRFGVVLGAVVLGSSVQSLRAWQQGKDTTSLIYVQAVAALVIAVKEASRFSATRAIFPTLIAAIISVAMVAFYAYVVSAGGPPKKKGRPSTETATI